MSDAASPTLAVRARRLVRERVLDRWLPGAWLESALFRHWHRELAHSATQSADWHAANQLARLREILVYSERHVPYYRRLFAEHGLRASDCRDLDYIRKIPLLDKETVRLHFDSLSSETAPPDSDLFTSGGSTGEPLALRRERSYWDIERAFITRAWATVGYRPGDRILQLRGNVVNPTRLAQGIVWQIDWRSRVMRLSPYDLSTGRLPDICAAIARFRPRFIHAYPTSAVLLATLFESAGYDFPVKLQAVLLGSEPVFSHQRERLSAVFGCRVFSHYGQAECVALATEAGDSETCHIVPDYSLVERLRADGLAASRPGERAEIVGTHFHVRAFPLIRYRTDDWVRLECGPSRTADFPGFAPLGPVLGRGQDVIVRKDGGFVALTAFSFGRHLRAYRHIRAMQFEQQSPGELRFRVVRGEGFDAEDEAELLTEFARNGGDQIRVTLDYVDGIARTPSGKMRHLIQHLSLDGLRLVGIDAAQEGGHE